MNLRDLMAKYRTDLLEIAKTTADEGKARWCRTFAANLGLAISEGEEPRERGMRMLRTNADLCDRLYVQRQRMEWAEKGKVA